MKLQKITRFASTVGKKYLLQELGDRDYCRLSKREKDLVKGVHVLCEFHETGSVQPVKEQTVFEGSIGLLMREYLSYNAWSRKNPNESDSYRYHRCVCLNQPASFLCKKGIRSYIPQLPSCKNTFTPYIFSYGEITALFKACDEIRSKKKIMNSVIMVLPALIRLLYGTGLRISEALALRNKDVNLDDNYLTLKDCKNGKERMIPISASLSEVCREYVTHRDLLPLQKPQTDYFFISLSGRACQRDAVHGWFQKILWKAGISRNDHGPRLHDLRHTFSVHSLAAMAESGVDLYCSLPTLSVYLGHQTLESTNAYVRLTCEMYSGLLKDVDVICFNVFPKTECYAAD